jgi:hypothetical protein
VIVGPRYNDEDPAVAAAYAQQERDDRDVYGCDYCGADYDASEGGYLRPVGFTTLTDDGPRLPLVKTWCGKCEPDDQTDPEAYTAARASITKGKP